jgi:hypothetical protein
MTSFSAQVSGFRDRTKEKLKAIVQQSTQDLFETANTPKANGGRLPVDTGFLRNSFVTALNGSGITTGEDSYILTLAG